MTKADPEISTGSPLTAEQIRHWLIEQLCEQLALTPDQIDVRTPLDSYGLDSAQALLLAARAERLLGFSIPPILLWHYPTIEALARRIAEEDWQLQPMEHFEL